MRLKYHEQIANCNDYNLDTYSEATRIAYRWVFEDIHHQKNFAPPNVLYPRPDSLKKQSYWALSFHSNPSDSIKRYRELTSDKEHLKKKLGTHIAEGILNMHDGISNNLGKEGHFDFFEYENVFLNNNFTIVRKVDEQD